jgi:hypothetical protein
MMNSVARAFFSVLAASAAVSSACAQSASPAEGQKFKQDFTFTLGTDRDRILQDIVGAINSRDEAQHALELRTAHESVFSRAIDELRFIPFKLSSSDMKSDDFFTPNYLRLDYNRPASEAHLVDNPK